MTLTMEVYMATPVISEKSSAKFGVWTPFANSIADWLELFEID